MIKHWIRPGDSTSPRTVPLLLHHQDIAHLFRFAENDQQSLFLGLQLRSLA